MEAVRFRKYFGEALADQREKANLSRKAIAEVLSVEESTVWRWEKGEVWPNDADVVVAIYEREGKASALDLWADALRRAKEAKGNLAMFLTADRPSVADLDQESAGRAARAARRASGDPPTG